MVTDVVAWPKKVQLVVRLQKIEDIASLLLLMFGERLALTLFGDGRGSAEARLKEAFLDWMFSAYTKFNWLGGQGSIWMPTKYNNLQGWQGSLDTVLIQ